MTDLRLLWRSPRTVILAKSQLLRRSASTRGPRVTPHANARRARISPRSLIPEPHRHLVPRSIAEVADFRRDRGYIFPDRVWPDTDPDVNALVPASSRELRCSRGAVHRALQNVWFAFYLSRRSPSAQSTLRDRSASRSDELGAPMAGWTRERPGGVLDQRNGHRRREPRRE